MSELGEIDKLRRCLADCIVDRKQLRELNAELLSALKGVTERLETVGHSDLSLGLVAIGKRAIRRAEGTLDDDVKLKAAIAKADEHIA